MTADQLIFQLVNILGFGGFVVWGFYYQMTSTIPKMEERFQQNLDRQMGQFREELAETRAHYERVIAKILADHEKAVATMVEACRGEREAHGRS